MLFNSFGFAVFFPIVFLIYWMINNNKYQTQNIFLLLSSFYFYSCWDWRFLFLLLTSIFLVYLPGIFMSKSNNKRTKKFWLWFSVVFSLGLLGVFKYYNFFIESFVALFYQLNIKLNVSTLNIILPVGISFYTFHGLSYIIDLYQKRINVEKNFITYALFVSYFPLLVAGPIERATHLLPQLNKKRVFDCAKSVDGLRQVLWGLFKKVVVADNCAGFVDSIFSNSTQFSSLTLMVGAVLFAFQIYCDFSGYSDIALGVSRMLGIELLKNFNFPYFSRDIAEFWRRWHISLTTWFRDYVYIPLGGSRGSKLITVRNIFIIFLVSGFWHGANWTFIVWGALNAFFFLPLLLTNRNRKNLEIVAKGKYFPNIRETISIIATFTIVTFAWIFFRADSITDAVVYIKGIVIQPVSTISLGRTSGILTPIVFVLIMVIIEWIGRHDNYAIEKFGFYWKKSFRISFYVLLTLLILWYSGTEQQFIYFQF